MSVFTRTRPSPAVIVAFVALALALTGSVAGAGTNGLYAKVTKSSVKKIANKQINKAAPGLSVAKAKNAKAVGGQTVHKMFAKVPSDSETATVLKANGLTLTADCAGGNLQFEATTSVDDSIFGSNVEYFTSSSGFHTSNFAVGPTINVIQGLNRGAGTFTYSQPDGTYVSGTFTADDSKTFGSFDGCVVVGTAFSG